MEISAANLTALFTGFDVIFQRGFETPPSYYEQIASIVRSGSRQTTYPWLGRTTKFREWLGSRVVQALESHAYTIVNKNFEDTVGIDRNDVEDDTYGVYAQPSDMIARYPNRDLVQLTNEDPTQTVVNQTVLQQALADASAEIDGYLASRFTLPLIDPPAVLARLTCDVAMYRLQALRPLHDLAEARKRYDDAVAVLLRVADGTLTLGLAPDNQEPPEAAGAAVTDAGGDRSGTLPQRVFSRGTLKGF